MEFSLLDFAKYGSQWWFALFGFNFGGTYVSLLHVERDMGVWKIDFVGIRAVYFWWKFSET